MCILIAIFILITGFPSASSWEVRFLIVAFHGIILKFCLKGGVESMAITEVFGGQYSKIL